MEWIRKIKWNQPKYVLPAILYVPILATLYFTIDMFQTDKAEIPDDTMQSTEYLNPTLPQAKVKNDIGGKYESMLKSYGKIDDVSAVSSIDRDNEEQKEEYESQYDESEAAAIEQAKSQQQAMEEQLRQSAERGTQMQNGDAPLALSESEQLIQSQQRERELQTQLNNALAEIRRQEQQKADSARLAVNGSVTVNEKAVKTPSEEKEPVEVVKKVRQSSDYFHTIADATVAPNLIKAIIDEDIKAVDGSRVRLRLLDDIEIGDVTMPKGSYLYAIMSGFSSQRVKGTVSSLLLNDELHKVSMSIYDTDGLEGLYVPSSQFRETSKDIASGAMQSNVSFNESNYGNSLSQWGMQAVQNAYQKTTNAISKSIKKNSAKLKYGTFVYLVNRVSSYMFRKTDAETTHKVVNITL